MIKTGLGEIERGKWAAHLGSDVCPQVYAITEGGYVMEMLEDIGMGPLALVAIENILEDHVWNRVVHREGDWFLALKARVGMLPDPPPACRGPSLVHGDCTASNLMIRSDGTLLIIDPLPPRRHVASVPESDMGKILQSAAGWETIAYGQGLVDYDPPGFWFRDGERRLALWWCATSARRIAFHEREVLRLRRPAVLGWCARAEEVCLDLARV